MSESPQVGPQSENQKVEEVVEGLLVDIPQERTSEHIVPAQQEDNHAAA